jgi:hypothetical protein
MGKAKKRRLSRREVADQHGASLPNREAMSLLAGLPSVGGPYVGDAQALALDNAPNPQDAASTASTEGQNVPNGQASAQSQT